MKFLVLLVVCFDIWSKVGTSEMKGSLQNVNAIQLPQKQEMVYPHLNQQAYVPVQVMQKPLFVPQQPTIMIIAQPAYVPQSFLYGNPAMAQQQQQLLNYFHTNPQARYQLLYGGYQPHPTMQPYISQNQLGASSIATYQIIPSPLVNNYNHLLQSYGQGGAVGQVGPLGQVGQVSGQVPGQVPLQFPSSIRSVPPIITGFENFTPEQQAQIKAQLSAHLGAPLATTAPIPSTTQEAVAPSQDKNSQDSTSFTPSLMYRSQFTKG